MLSPIEHAIIASVTTAAAAFPRSQDHWRKNPGAAIRRLDEALAIGSRHGVPVDDFLWFVERAERFGSGELATYALPRRFTDTSSIRRAMFVTGQDERYRIRLNESILGSDDAILAVLIHETHEILGLDEAFGVTGESSGRAYFALVDTVVGTLHCDAWEAADRVVLSLIESERWP